MVSRIAITALLASSAHAFLAPTCIFRGKPLSHYLTATSATSLQMNQEGVRAKKRANRAKPQGFAGALRDIQMQTFPYSGSVRPGKQSPKRTISDPKIMLPDYALDGRPKKVSQSLPWVIEVKTTEEIELMRAAGRCAREVLDIAGRAVQAGVTTDWCMRRH